MKRRVNRMSVLVIVCMTIIVATQLGTTLQVRAIVAVVFGLVALAVVIWRL